jgi:CRP-like cAMP-binding protein
MSLARDSLLILPSDDGGEACVAKRQTSRRLPRSAKNRPPPSTNRPPPTANRPPPTENPNLLLAALPAADYARILPELSVVPLTLKTLLHKPGEPVRHVYFPGGGFCSMLTVLEDGTMVEVATVGREGVIGLSAVLDDGPSTSVSMVQGASDSCYRMTAENFRREMDRRGPFFDALTHYAQALVGFIMQSTACNAVHNVEQRLARWLLTAHDHMRNDTFPLTQEFVAMMLGVARPTVAVVAGKLQRAGLITYHRGQLTIVDREQLETAACECYRTAANLLAAAGPVPGTREKRQP